MSATETPPEEAQPKRARDHWDQAADWTWGVMRRIHLGTRKPGNWLQLFHFAVVGGSGYVVNLIVFTLLSGGAGINHLLAAVGAFAGRGQQQLPPQPPLDLPPPGSQGRPHAASRQRDSSPSASSASPSACSSSSCW